MRGREYFGPAIPRRLCSKTGERSRHIYVCVWIEGRWVRCDPSDGIPGAKGVGEVATFCVSPAIANAIDDAVGVRLTELPLNPEAVYRALRAKAGAPLEAA